MRTTIRSLLAAVVVALCLAPAAASAATAHLAVLRLGGGTGTVTGVPGVANCGSGCAADVPANTPLTLHASAPPGMQFTGWLNCDSVAFVTECTVSMNSNREVYATFESAFVPILASHIAAEGGGVVLMTRAGIVFTCSEARPCDTLLPIGTPLFLQAVPDPGYTLTVFVGCGYELTCNLSGFAPPVAVARFEGAPPPPPPQDNSPWAQQPDDARTGAAVLRLSDGRVLIAGGRGEDGSTLDVIRIYAPADATSVGYETAGTMLQPRAGAAALQLPDGRVLIAGGGPAGNEIFDPRTGASTDGPDITPVDPPAAPPVGPPFDAASVIPLPNGRWAAACGSSSQYGLYDPETNAWSTPRPLPGAAGRAGCQLAAAGNGVLLIGGTTNGSVRGDSWLYPMDLLAPVLTVPADIHVASGVIVDFSASAVDAIDAAPTVSCSAASGATFPVGTTVVSCTARDASGNTSLGRFTVTVDPPIVTASLVATPSTAAPGAAVLLDARGSIVSDPRRSVALDRVQFTGPFGSIPQQPGVPGTALAFFPRIGTYSVTAVVPDDGAPSIVGMASATIAVTITDTPPHASIDGPFQVIAGAAIRLSGIADDGDLPVGDTATYAWSIDGVTVKSGAVEPGEPAAVVLNSAYTSALSLGSHTVRLVVTDSFNASTTTSDTLMVVTPNVPPSVDAGADVVYVGAASATVRIGPKSASDPEGGPLEYRHARVNSDGAVIALDPWTPIAELEVTLLPGPNTFRIFVRDAAGAITFDDVVVTGNQQYASAAVPLSAVDGYVHVDQDGGDHLVVSGDGAVQTCDAGKTVRVSPDAAPITLSCVEVAPGDRAVSVTGAAVIEKLLGATSLVEAIETGATSQVMTGSPLRVIANDGPLPVQLLRLTPGGRELVATMTVDPGESVDVEGIRDVDGVDVPSITALAGTVTVTYPDGLTRTLPAGATLTVDRIAPVLTLPPSIVVDATSAAGASVAFIVTATDNLPGVVTICSKASGATFPIGTTPVTCTATDTAGSVASGAFDVTVKDVMIPGDMRGDGRIEVAGAPVSFAFDVRERVPQGERGRLEVQLRAASPGRQKPVTFTSRAVTFVAFSDDPGFRSGAGRRAPAVDSVHVSGTGEWNGAPGYTWEAYATDEGEPGRGRDSFALTIRDPNGAVVFSGSGALTNGNIQSRRLPGRD